MNTPKNDEGINPTDAEGVKKFLAPELPKKELPKKTQEERTKEAKDVTERRTSCTKFLYRQLRYNPDIILLIALCVLFAFLGYCLAYVHLAFTAEQIKVGIKDFFEILVTIAGCFVAFVWKLYTPPGRLTEKLNNKEKDEDKQVDEYGLTVTKRK
jgi:hypothetical protein